MAKDKTQDRLSNHWAKISIYFLVVAMLVGVFLRMSSFYTPFRFNYRFLVHTHSHLVLLGWAFNAVAALLYYQYKEFLSRRKCRILFILFQISLVGMMVSFPIQGYAFYSILFSTLHIIVSYFFVGHFLMAMKSSHDLPVRFVKLGFVFYLISTFGPFSLGPIIVTGNSQSPMYDLAIYFYLHFFYNGFFVFAILGIFLSALWNSINLNLANRAYNYLGLAVVPTYILSMFCHFVFGWLYAIGFVAAALQIAGFFYFLSFIRTNKSVIREMFPAGSRKFLVVSLLSLGLKMVLQLLSALPFTTSLICHVHPFVVGYLHLVFIGFVTFSLLGLLFQQRLFITKDGISKWSFIALFVGFVFSEIFILSPVFNVLSWNVIQYLIFFFSVMMFLGTILQLRQKID